MFNGIHSESIYLPCYLREWKLCGVFKILCGTSEGNKQVIVKRADKIGMNGGTIKGENNMLNLILKVFGLQVAKVVVQKWPSKEDTDKSWGRSGYESLYK